MTLLAHRVTGDIDDGHRVEVRAAIRTLSAGTWVVAGGRGGV